MPSFYGENPPDTEVGSTDATESQISEDAVTETDTSGGFYQGSPEQTTIEAFEEDARQAKEAAEAAQEAAEAAQAAAESSETAASSSETSAAASATSATSSASSAASSATNAASSATSAASSATSAASSAADAASSASDAAASETAAATSETNAASSATNASTSASNASTSETNAASSASSAAGSATSASNSAASASTSASAAATSATNAATSESNASTSASNAASSATNSANSAAASASSATSAAGSASAAATSASNAASSETAAASSASDAASSASDAAASYDDFDDRYLGSKSSEPSTDNDGNTIQTGALFFDTTAGSMKVWTGTAWEVAYASVSGAMLRSNNLSDLDNIATARTNLGLGTAATTASTAYATAAQGLLADSAVQPGDNVSGLTNDAGYATTTYVDNEVAGLVDAAPATLDTLNELAAALGDDANFSTTVTNSIATKWTQDNTKITNWDTAYGWGNHASAGYQAASTALTTSTTFGGDVSGTYNAIVVADDSHNHVISNVDGLQSALDAKLASSSYTAADVLTKIKTVDGSGSGLDADLLDGVHGSSFLRSDASDTATGLITFSNATDAQITLDGANTTWAGIKWQDVNGVDYIWYNGQNSTFAIGGSGSNVAGKKLHVDGGMSVGASSGATAMPSNGIYSEGIIQGASGYRVVNSNTSLSQGSGNALRVSTNSGYVDVGPMNTSYAHFQTDRANFYFSSPIHAGGQIYNYVGGGTTDPYWRAGNDGSGSGLDADLLDGQHGSYYLTDNTYLLRDDNRTISPSEYTSGRLAFGFTSWANNNSSPYADFLHMRSYTDSSGGADNLLMLKKDGIGMRLWQQTYGSTTAYSSYVDVWHTGNDGSGSGLDADLLDGYDSASYLNKNASSYYQASTWIDFRSAGQAGLYWGPGSASAGWHIYPTSTGNMILRSGTSSYCQIELNAAGTNRAYIYADSGNNAGWLNSSAGWRMRLPSSGSFVRYEGSTQYTMWDSGNDGSGSGLDADTLDGYHYYSFWRDNETRRIGVLKFTGEGGNSGNGTESYGIMQEGGAWSNPYPDLHIGFHTGIKIGGYYGYNGTRFYNDAPSRSGATEVMSVADGNNNVDVINALTSYSYQGNSNVAGTGSASYHPSGIYSTGTNWLYGTMYMNGNSQYMSGGSMFSTNRIVCDQNYGEGVYGVYSSYRYQHVWMMSPSYKLASNGQSVGNAYGMSYTHTNVGTGTNQAISGLSHQLQGRENGNLVWALGTGIWTAYNITAYSDISVKTNLEVIPDALAKVCQLNGYTYDRTDYKVDPLTGEMPETRQAGVVAQEVEKVLPEVVSGEEGNKAVAYGNMVALLIEAIKELKAEVNDLKAQLERS